MIAGARLGPYEIVAPLGAGGLGEERSNYWKQISHLFVVEGAR
ncbi:MAG TPA: hypothetical protein VJ776_00800 [Thermoanaerobaculia bacterium]|nr:hypothetical protein [Thermoanaerobaculia bacterium]